jgi:hypothetical protein
MLKNPLQSVRNNQTVIVIEGCWKCIKNTCGPHLWVPYQWRVTQSTYRETMEICSGLCGPLGSHTTPDPIVFCMESWNLMQASFTSLLYNFV